MDACLVQDPAGFQLEFADLDSGPAAGSDYGVLSLSLLTADVAYDDCWQMRGGVVCSDSAQNLLSQALQDLAGDWEVQE